MNALWSTATKAIVGGASRRWMPMETSRRGIGVADDEPSVVASGSAAQLRPFVEAQAFHQAYAAGVASVTPEQLFDDAHYTRNQKVLFTLQFLWPVIPKFNSVGELHRELARVLGEPKVGDLKSFQKLAGDIGLRLRGRGRPRKQK